jgi:hypothetical protein
MPAIIYAYAMIAISMMDYARGWIGLKLKPFLSAVGMIRYQIGSEEETTTGHATACPWLAHKPASGFLDDLKPRSLTFKPLLSQGPA